MPKPTLKRLRDWPLRLEAFMAERADAPFAWGRNDCCTFVADMVKTITGEDAALPALRTHRTEAQALATLSAHGGVRAIAAAALGAALPANRATVGDVMLVRITDANGNTQNALAACNGDIAFMPGAQGLVTVPCASALCCWRVG